MEDTGSLTRTALVWYWSKTQSQFKREKGVGGEFGFQNYRNFFKEFLGCLVFFCFCFCFEEKEKKG
jgi:hypothetical protein